MIPPLTQEELTLEARGFFKVDASMENMREEIVGWEIMCADKFPLLIERSKADEANCYSLYIGKDGTYHSYAINIETSVMLELVEELLKGNIPKIKTI